jgi:ABC-2 type transport system permease protein
MLPSAVLLAIMGCVAAFAFSIVSERAAGPLVRLRVAPLSRAQLLAGKGLACFLASTAVALFLLLLGNVIFKVRLSDPAQLVVAIVCTGIGFVGIMMLLATLGKTEQSVAGAGWGILMLLAMFGGAMVPLMFMPDWMQTASNLSPIKWGILALEGAIWRGFSWTEMLLPCGIMLAIGAVCFALGVRNLARAEG